MLDNTRHPSISRALAVDQVRQRAIDNRTIGARAYAAEVVRAFAPMFDVQESAELNSAIQVVIALDEFARCIDHVTDMPRPDISEVHDGVLALARGVQLASSLGQKSDRFFQRLEVYLAEASQAEKSLWRHRGYASPFNSADIEDLGRKNAIMKSAPAILAQISGRFDLLPCAEDAVHDIAVATQLIDDLLDWSDDLHAEIFTYPLVLALEAAPPTEEAVADAIFCGGIGISVLHEVDARLGRAIGTLGAAKAGGTLALATRAQASVVEAIQFLLGSDHAPGHNYRELRSRLHPVICYSG